MKIFGIIVLSALILVSCGQRAGKTTSLCVSEPFFHAEGQIDSMAAIVKMLDKEDSTAIVENAVIKSKSIITAQDLLSLRPVHSLESDSDNIVRILATPDKGLRLANRFMRMHYASGGTPDNELVWVDAVQRMFAQYCKKNNCAEEQAWKDFMDGIDFLACGTQPEINRYCYVTASVEYYRALAANKVLIDVVKDHRLKALLLEEYRTWNELNGYRQSAFVHIRMAGQHYSALPMNFEGNYAAQAILRKENMALEREILMNGKPYELQHEVVTTAIWQDYLSNRLSYNPDAVYEKDTEPEVAQRIARGLDESVTKWLAARHEITRYLTEPKATYYDNMTADYHWVITNEAEVVPEGYD